MKTGADWKKRCRICMRYKYKREFKGSSDGVCVECRDKRRKKR